MLALCAFAALGGTARSAEPVRLLDCGAVALTDSHLEISTLPAAPQESGERGVAAADRFPDQAFAAAAGHSLNFGPTSRVLLKFSVVNEGCDGPVHLDLGNPFANRVRLHRQASDGRWVNETLRRAGGSPTRLRFAIERLELDRGTPTVFVAEITGPAAIVLTPRLVGDGAARDALGWRMGLAGLITGAIVALGAYCALLGSFTRFSGLIAFSVSALSLGALYALTTGMLDTLLIGLIGGAEQVRAVVMRLGAVFVLGAALFQWIFVRRLLGVPRSGSLDDGQVRALLALWGTTLVGVLLSEHAWVGRVSVVIALVTVAAIVRELVRASRSGHPLAAITVSAFAALAVGVIAYVGLVEGLLPAWSWIVHVLGLGILVESLLLAAAVAAQVRNLRGRHQRLAERTNALALLSQLDALTGLGNRRAYDASVAAELERCQRRGRAASLLVIDIDHFKAVNDSHGHAFGDSVIRVLGVTIANCIRTTDRAYRYGGEEFVALLPGLDSAMAREVGERIMREFTNCSPTAPDGTRPFFSVSIGLAQMRAGDDARALFERADFAMYRAKQRGRCRLESIDDACDEPAEVSIAQAIAASRAHRQTP